MRYTYDDALAKLRYVEPIAWDDFADALVTSTSLWMEWLQLYERWYSIKQAIIFIESLKGSGTDGRG